MNKKNINIDKINDIIDFLIIMLCGVIGYFIGFLMTKDPYNACYGYICGLLSGFFLIMEIVFNGRTKYY